MSPELQQSLQGVRTQYRAMFKRMAYEGHRWHLHSVPGTDRYCLLRDDAKMDVHLPIAVHNAHAMTEQQLVDKAGQHARGQP